MNIHISHLWTSRIAHMGHVNAPTMLGALGVIEMGLIALDIPHGSGGTQKAIEYLGKNFVLYRLSAYTMHYCCTGLIR